LPSAPASPVRAEVVQDPAAKDFAGTVWIGSFKRTVTYATCEETASALGIIASMVLEGEPASGELPAVSPKPAAPPIEPPIVVVAPAPVVAAPRPTSHYGWAGLGAGATLIHTSVVPNLHASFYRSIVGNRLVLGAGIVGQYQWHRAVNAEYAATLRWLTARPMLCGAVVGLLEGQLEVAGCVVGEIGVMWVGSVTGAEDVQTAAVGQLGAGALGRVRWAFGASGEPLRLTLALDASLVANLRRTRYTIDDGTRLFQVPQLAPQLALSFGLEFR
jgi:hypothetical protein